MIRLLSSRRTASARRPGIGMPDLPVPALRRVGARGWAAGAIATLLLVTLLTLCPGNAAAAPLDPRSVDAEATWLVHVDVDALRRCESVDRYVVPLLEMPQVARKIERIREDVGLDVTRDLHGITLYGSELVADRGVLIVNSDVDGETLGEFVEGLPDHEVETIRGRTVHQWTDRHGGNKHTVYATMHGPKTMLFSRDPAELTAAADVLDRRRPGLAPSGPLTEQVPEGTVVLLSARDLGRSPLGLKSPILRLSEMLTVVAGERGSEAFVEVRLKAKSAEHVSEFRDVAAGLVALGRLLRADDEDTLRVLDDVAVESNENTVMTRWSGQTESLVKAIMKERLRAVGLLQAGR